MGAGAVCLALLSLSGCSTAKTAVKAAQEVVDGNCHDEHPHALVLIDGTNSQNDPEFIEDKVGLVDEIATDVSEQCGTITVEIFGSTSTDHTTVVDAEDLTPPGEYDGAREEVRDARVDPVVHDVREALEAHVPTEGTATLGALTAGARLLGDVVKGGRPARLYVLSDGYETEAFEARALLRKGADAAALLDLVPAAPDLQGIDVTLAGVGLVSGTPRPTAMTDTLLEFYEHLLCEVSGADPCTITDRFSTEVA